MKTWVDDRNKTPKKLTPELYGAALDEAHKYNLRTIAHVYDLERRTASLCVYSNGLRTLSILSWHLLCSLFMSQEALKREIAEMRRQEADPPERYLFAIVVLLLILPPR